VPRRRGRALRQTQALHALAHPLRVRILEQLREPASAAEVARRLAKAAAVSAGSGGSAHGPRQLAPSRQNLNYHLKELARGGLVRRTGRRRAGGFTETLYQANADSLVITAEGPVALADCETADTETGQTLPAGRWQGTVHSLHVALAAGSPMTTVEQVRAVAGRGLEGDRYFEGIGTFSKKPGTGRDVTLIELEALRALFTDHGVELAPSDARRNVVTCGVPLNHLVGHEFRVGRVVLRGMRFCEPCTYLSGVVGKDVKTGLIHRGGLRADIVRAGTIRVGDHVSPC
jgi:DNA-binding transcriptional ArsR family regulator